MRSVRTYLGTDDADAFADAAALEATVRLVSSIDQFLLAVVPPIFTFLSAVLFLEGALVADESPVEWSALVIPISVGIFVGSFWLIDRAK